MRNGLVSRYQHPTRTNLPKVKDMKDRIASALLAACSLFNFQLGIYTCKIIAYVEPYIC